MHLFASGRVPRWSLSQKIWPGFRLVGSLMHKATATGGSQAFTLSSPMNGSVITAAGGMAGLE